MEKRTVTSSHGLVLRQTTADDTEAAAEFQAQVHLPHTFAESFRIWIRDLMSGVLPGFQPGDFTLVEDAGSCGLRSTLYGNDRSSGQMFGIESERRIHLADALACGWRSHHLP